MITAFESPAVIAGFDDVAVVSQTIEQRGRHLGSPNTLGHLPNARLVVTMIEVIRADGRRVEQKLTAGLCEFQIEVNWGL